MSPRLGTARLKPGTKQTAKHRKNGFRSYLCNLVKLAEEFVERVDQFTRRAVAGQPGESHNVGIQNAAREHNRRR